MTEEKSGNKKQDKSYLKILMKKAKKAVNLVMGNAEDYTEEDAGGDLRFDPGIMMKINVTFDKNFLPREKVLKLNLRGARFFSEIKKDIREINGVYIVYPHVYAYQLDTRKAEWEKKLIHELNNDYGLELEMIRFFNEEDVSRLYQRSGINTIRDPYHLQEGELLVIAGGFANFNTKGIPLCQVNVEASTIRGKRTVKKTYNENYLTKFSDMAGAYFYVGGEWYHNLFIPGLLDNDEPRFFSFRIADDGKNLLFFSDPHKRGIDIRGKVKTETTPDQEKIIHTINPKYLEGTQIKELVLTVIYDIEEKVDSLDVGVGTGETSGPDDKNKDNFPFLETAMILLPAPNEKDIPSYIMTIGSEKKGFNIFASSTDKEISILSPLTGEKIFKKNIKDEIDYSIKFGRLSYSISNEFISRFRDRELKAYFSWTLSSNMPGRIPLAGDFYVLGRDPFGNLPKKERNRIKNHLVKLNEGAGHFWRIGTSRNHALLLKETRGSFRVYNISLSFPVYVVKEKDLEEHRISPFRIDPVRGEKKEEKLELLLAWIGKGMTDGLASGLNEYSESLELENNDLIIVGNRVYKYITPMVMKSPLSSSVQMSVLRKIQESSSVMTT
ncbi:MAG: hypothetical protein GTO45_29615 [Candidatus Aminicenantes bacterium]|nr:hypothetical protein [Candidatus Aminicenantes bacterium]NIM82952.1 hypothetical protein [Candidatus Aminicenantes bacterium]NIN22329.1 hypothetical protein [Candidatus Aminicenantes bacterium]NIN46097.1 hypothetical protein [Candidatus Aminicenantes bacterium]NIN88933.1 hypothetical protein [Candidatus Aminicenantes bacterium]